MPKSGKSQPPAPKVTYLVTVVITPGQVETSRPRTPKSLQATIHAAFPRMTYAILTIEHDGKAVKAQRFPGKNVNYL